MRTLKIFFGGDDMNFKQWQDKQSMLRNLIWRNMENKLSLVLDDHYDFSEFLLDLNVEFSTDDIQFSNSLRDDDFDCDTNVHIVSDKSIDYELYNITVNIDNLFIRINIWRIWRKYLNILFPFLRKINKPKIDFFIEEISIKILDQILYFWLKMITKNKICDFNNHGYTKLMLRNYRHKRISLVRELCSWPKLLKELSKNWRIYLEHKKIENSHIDSIKWQKQSKSEDRIQNLYDRIVNSKKLKVTDIFQIGGDK